MSNMSYCRFQNTLQDLRNCFVHIYDVDLSPEEERARKLLIKVCTEIHDEVGPEVSASWDEE